MADYSQTTKNVSPYFDDFDETKNFMRVIFNPARAVQARELTTLQTILSNQITSFADHIFKDGTSVLGGSVFVDNKAPFIVIATEDLVASNDTDPFDGVLNNPYSDNGLIGMHFKQATTNAIGKVVQVDDLSGTLRIHLEMHSGDFVANGTVAYQITAYDMNELDVGRPHWQTQTTGTHVTTIGTALKASVSEGIVYINGVFVKVVADDTIWVNSAAATGDYTVGFLMVEDDISSGDDNSLTDVASGLNNGAPGANRWKVSVELVAYTLAATPPTNYYQVMRYESSVLVEKQDKVQYADIMEMLARRTYDESGSYVIKQFYGDAVLFDGSNFKYRISAGKAYVNGYEQEKIAPSTIVASKSRITRLATDEANASQYGTWVQITDASSDVVDLFDQRIYTLVHLMTGTGGTGTSLNTARVIYVENTSSANNILLYLGDSLTLSTDLETTQSLAIDNAGSPDTSQYVDIALPWAGTASRYLKNSPVIELQNQPVRDVTGATYQTTLRITKTPVASGQFTLVAGNSDLFVADQITAVIRVSDGVMMDVSTDGVFPTNSIGGSGTGTLTIEDTHGLAAVSYDFLVRVSRPNAGSRTKTLTAEDVGVAGTFQSDANGVIEFDGVGDWPAYYDVALVDLIEEDPAGTPIDVTLDGILDSGQKNYYYDYSSISGLKATTAYRVTLHRWVHTGTGDYFSADSYGHGSDDIFLYWGGDDGDGAVDGAAYANIGMFTNEERTKTYNLRNCLDFRRNIVEVNASTIMEIIEPNSIVLVDYNYYLPRMDKIWIDTAGVLGITEGIAEELPSPPPDLANTITLFITEVQPYIFGPGTASASNAVTEVSMNAIDNRNYTMRDIGRLEKRLQSLEYYTSENQLNSEAYSEDIVDVDGNLKSKSGIFVEKFVDHRNGQTSNPGYRCAMDGRTGMMRSPYEMNRIGFQPDPNETQSNINEGAHTYTLSYTAVSHIEQMQENECMNINPFAVAIWAGTVEMDPKSDDWIETEYLPVLQLNDPVLESQMAALYARNDVGIPMWGEWQTTIIGVEESAPSVEWIRQRRGDEFFRPNRFGIMETTIVETTTIQSERTGTILEQSGTQSINVDYGERVVDVSMIPFMRKLTIGFTADGLKPETTVIPFFADRNIAVDVTFDTAKTDQTGRITGSFVVPEQTFRTGINVFQLQDSTTDPLTFAATEFAATGILQTKQQSILSVEVPVFTTRSIAESIITENQEINVETELTTQWYDPLAQTFLIEDAGGMFLESVDIFFCKKDRYIPVTLQIVEVSTGLPTQIIVPFGSVTKRAADIMATYYDGVDFRYNGDHYYALDHGQPDELQFGVDLLTGGSEYTPTNFQFSDPVYLKENTEYAIVLLSNSNNYTVRVATLGTIDNVTGNAIVSQPYMGSLLKSQNASTWTPDQQRDLMFRIKRCNFSSSGDLFLRTTGQEDYWDSAITYAAANLTEVIFDNGTRHLRYLCIVDTLAGESPTGPESAKWQLLTDVDGQHDVSLVNINFEEMLLSTTDIAPLYKFTGNSLVSFQNKTDIQLDTLQAVELYNEDTAPGAAPNIIDLKMVMTSSNVMHSPVIAKGRTSAVLVNNLVVTADSADSDATWDAGEYQSRTVVLREASTDLRVLLDILNSDENADQLNSWESVVVKYRTTKKTLRYVERDPVPTKELDVGLKDNICYVYWINDALTDPASDDPKFYHSLGDSWLGANTFDPRGQVVIDGFNQDTSPQRVYLSSISDPGDFVIDAEVGNQSDPPWTLVTTEAGMIDSDIFVWNSLVNDDYISGDYAIENHNLYVANTTTRSKPSQNSGVDGDWTRIDSVMTQDVVKEDNDFEWVKMLRTTTPSADFDITSQYYEHEFEPMITPSEEFYNFAIKIEMYSNDEIKVPQVRRLRAIAAA